MEPDFVDVEPRFVNDGAPKLRQPPSTQDWLIENARLIVGIFVVLIFFILFYIWWTRDDPAEHKQPAKGAPSPTPPPTAAPPSAQTQAQPTQAPSQPHVQPSPPQPTQAPLPPAKKEPTKEASEYMELFQKSQKTAEEVVIEMESPSEDPPKETEPSPSHDVVEITPTPLPSSSPPTSYSICTAIMTSGYRCKKKAVTGDRCNLHQNR
jgi:hypothetical protein